MVHNKLFELTCCFKLQNHKKLNFFISIQARGGLISCGGEGGVESNRMNFLFTGRWTYSWGVYNMCGLTDCIS